MFLNPVVQCRYWNPADRHSDAGPLWIIQLPVSWGIFRAPRHARREKLVTLFELQVTRNGQWAIRCLPLPWSGVHRACQILLNPRSENSRTRVQKPCRKVSQKAKRAFYDLPKGAIHKKGLLHSFLSMVIHCRVQWCGGKSWSLGLIFQSVYSKVPGCRVQWMVHLAGASKC